MNKFLLEQQAGQLHGPIKTYDVTVSGSPTIVPPDAMSGRKKIRIQNRSGSTVWLGGDDVSQFNGLELLDDGDWEENLGRSNLYVTTAGTTVSGIRVMEIS